MINDMTTKRKTVLITICILLAATLIFIWGHSLKSIPESAAQSLRVLENIEPLLEIFVGEGNVSDHLVRKLAHFIEFGGLGLELMALLIIRKRVRLQPIINCLFAGFFVAAMDETIQIFSERGSQLQDVWLDFAGVCAGIGGVLLIRWVASPKHKNRKDELSNSGK